MPLVGDLPKFVKLSVVPRRDKATVNEHHRRIVCDCAVNKRNGLRPRGKRIGAGVKQGKNVWNRAQRVSERLQVARVRAERVDLLDETLEVAHARKKIAQRGEPPAVVDKRLDAVETRVHVCGAGKRTAYPVAKRPRAHRRLRDVEDSKKRRFLRNFAARNELEMAQGSRVEHKRIVGTANRDLADVRKRVAKRGADIVEKSPRRGDEIALPREAEAVERKDLEMARQRFGRRVERESPAVVVCLGKRLGGAVSFKRLVKFLLRLELLNHELASRKV